MSSYEELLEDAKRDRWAEENLRECPECGGELVKTDYQRSSRTEPGYELWECKNCGHEEGLRW